MYERSKGTVKPLIRTQYEIFAQIEKGTLFFVMVAEEGVPVYDAGGHRGDLCRHLR